MSIVVFDEIKSTSFCNIALKLDFECQCLLIFLGKVSVSLGLPTLFNCCNVHILILHFSRDAISHFKLWQKLTAVSFGAGVFCLDELPKVTTGPECPLRDGSAGDHPEGLPSSTPENRLEDQ